MRVDSFSSGGYEWFGRIIKIIDALAFLNINSVEELESIDKNKLESTINSAQTKISANAINKLHTTQSNALIAYNMWNGQFNTNSADDSKNWMIIQLNNFKQVSVASNVSIKTQDFVVIRTIVKYLTRTVYVFCIYESDITVPELRSNPLEVFSLFNGKDLYGYSLSEESLNHYLFKSKNKVVLKVSKNSLNVSECCIEDNIKLSDTAAGIISSILDEMKIGDARSTAKTVRDIAVTRIKRVLKGVSIADEELKWVCNVFNVHFEEVTASLDKILKTAAKERDIDVFGNKFNVIDIMRIKHNVLMIRTTYFDESSQFIMLFEVSQTIQTLVFCILDVFPHEGASGTKYTVSNNIKSASRTNIIGCSRVNVIAGRDIIVTEDISLKYCDLEISISDSITLQDSVGEISNDAVEETDIHQDEDIVSKNTNNTDNGKTLNEMKFN